MTDNVENMMATLKAAPNLKDAKTSLQHRIYLDCDSFEINNIVRQFIILIILQAQYLHVTRPARSLIESRKADWSLQT